MMHRVRIWIVEATNENGGKLWLHVFDGDNAEANATRMHREALKKGLKVAMWEM